MKGSISQTCQIIHSRKYCEKIKGIKSSCNEVKYIFLTLSPFIYMERVRRPNCSNSMNVLLITNVIN